MEKTMFNRAQADTLREMAATVGEADAISKKIQEGRSTSGDKRRLDFLFSKISLLKAGMTAGEFREYELNKRAIEAGELPVDFARERKNALTPEEQLFRAFMNGNEREQRDLVTNNPQLGSISSNMGTFVPLDFYNNVVEALAQVDPLTDERYVGLIKETGLNTKPLQIPAWDLTSIASEQVTESSDAPSTDFVTPVAHGKLLGGYMHRLNLVASFEFDQDSFRSTMQLLARAYGVGFARGIGQQLVTGSGTSEPQGIEVFAANSGVVNATPGTIALDDLLNIYFSVNRIYRASSKCCWVMPDSCYKAIRRAKDADNRPLLDVERDGETLFGHPVLVSPSLTDNGLNPSLEPSKIIFGDLSHFYVRLSELSIVRKINNPGIVEKGLALYQGLMRVDSWVCDPSSGSIPPVVYASIS
jgi:HK97 family phage major capsid protein